MEEYIVKNRKKLRLGYTTGSCAAAAAKAAVYMLLTGRPMERVRLITPKGITLELPVVDINISKNYASCAVIKDAGDDPDVTAACHVTVGAKKTDNAGIIIDGGQGVGRVTKPGLDQPVGAAAINSVPRAMICESVAEICSLLDYSGGVELTVSVPGGEQIAQKTFNPRLGIEGGISILGTTGIVEPMSEQALVDTIRIELRQRRENGAEYVLLTPGNYGADFIRMGLNAAPELSVQTSNFIGDALEMCTELGFKGVLLVGHIGKLVKLAGGIFNTHSRYGDCRMDILTSLSAVHGISQLRAGEMLDCVTCDDAIRIMQEEGICDKVLTELTRRISEQMKHRAPELETGVIYFSKVYGMLGKSDNADELLRKITEG